MRDWCDQAQLFHCSTPGLRKASATIATKNGANDRERMVEEEAGKSEEACGERHLRVGAEAKGQRECPTPPTGLE